MKDNILLARYITKDTLERKLKAKFGMPLECFDDRQLSRVKRAIADVLCEISDDQLINEAIESSL